MKPLQHNTSEACYLLQEKQLKKIRAKQKRLQAVLDGEDIQKLEAELLIEDDEGKFEAQSFAEALHTLLAFSMICIRASYTLLILLNNHFAYMS